MNTTGMLLIIAGVILLAASGGAAGLMALELNRVPAKSFSGADAWMNPHHLFRAHRESFPGSILRKLSLSSAVIAAVLVLAAAILDSK